MCCPSCAAHSWLSAAHGDSLRGEPCAKPAGEDLADARNKAAADVAAMADMSATLEVCCGYL